MQIRPRARQAHWLTGRAVCCGILRRTAACAGDAKQLCWSAVRPCVRLRLAQILVDKCSNDALPTDFKGWNADIIYRVNLLHFGCTLHLFSGTSSSILSASLIPVFLFLPHLLPQPSQRLLSLDSSLSPSIMHSLILSPLPQNR